MSGVTGNASTALAAKATGNMLMFMHNDQDLKEIIDCVNYLQTPLDLIKYLSEIPLQEVNQRNYIRKHNLLHQLHSMIQADLRQAIQDKLINEICNDNKKTEKQQTQDDSVKNKKKKPDGRNKRKGGQGQQQKQQQQVQTYQKKKQSISKSPQRQPQQTSGGSN